MDGRQPIDSSLDPRSLDYLTMLHSSKTLIKSVDIMVIHFIHTAMKGLRKLRDPPENCQDSAKLNKVKLEDIERTYGKVFNGKVPPSNIPSA